MRGTKDKVLTERQSARMVRILESAQRLLGEVGVEQMTMRDLAAASGVSAATLYNRFGTKDGVVTHAVLDHYERAVRSVVERSSGSETAAEKIVHGVNVIVKDCQRRRGFAAALMTAYFKIDSEREMPTRLYQSLMQSWLPPLQVMRDSGLLHAWVSIPLLAEELCDRMFGVVMKWAQGTFPRTALADRAVLTVMLPLAAASCGSQAGELEQLLSKVSRQLSVRGPSKRSK